jgi:hypothetical protein
MDDEVVKKLEEIVTKFEGFGDELIKVLSRYALAMEQNNVQNIKTNKFLKDLLKIHDTWFKKGVDTNNKES